MSTDLTSTPDRLHVLHVINGLGTGGAERSLAELLPGLRDDHGIDSTVVCLLERAAGVGSGVAEAGFDVRTLDASTLRGRVRELSRLLEAVRPDLVHTTLFDADLIGRLSARRLRLPVLTSLVNTSYDRARLADPRVGRFKLEVGRHIEGLTARRLTARFHAISEAVKDASVAALRIPPELVSVVPRGRDPRRVPFATDARRARARSRLGLGPDAQVIVNVGRQEYQKGQIHLLRAVARLAHSHPDLLLLVAGREGNCTDELRRDTERLGIADRVRWLGFRGDVPDVLAAADVFAFPSMFEGLGGAALEALAVGIPIVASDLPALREVVGSADRAALVTAGSDEELAAAIARVLSEPGLRSTWGRAGRRRFEERFTVAASTRGMVALYRDVVPAGALV